MSFDASGSSRVASGAGDATGSSRATGGRTVRDARDLRALSHPLRLRLLELLDDGPLTATEAAAALDTTPANCSFHLRLLARHGFVTEADGGAGRQRPWRLTGDVSIDSAVLDDDGRRAADAVVEVLDEQRRARVAQWRRERHTYPPAWHGVATEAFGTAHVTAAELTELVDALQALLGQYFARPRSERPAGAIPIDIHLAAVPRRRPDEETT